MGQGLQSLTVCSLPPLARGQRSEGARGGRGKGRGAKVNEINIFVLVALYVLRHKQYFLLGAFICLHIAIILGVLITLVVYLM